MDNAEADLTVGPLKIWIHHYEFPDTTDYWDTGFLTVSAEVNLPEQAWVRAVGPFFTIAELSQFRDEMKMVYDNLNGEAGLWTIEPNLKIRLDCKDTGSITAEIELTPNQTSQEHRFHADIDQSYLPQAMAQIDVILERFMFKEDVMNKEPNP